VTLAILDDTALVPAEACCTLRAISLAAAPCSSTAEAIEVAISLTLPIVLVMLLIAELGGLHAA
jgi:hypothetical protein